MSDLTPLLAKLKALPFLETPLARKGKINYGSLKLTNADVPTLAEIADPMSSIFENMADPDDDIELQNLISASFHAAAALASLKNPDHFPYFHRFLLKAYDVDHPSFTESFPYYIAQLGPDVIPPLLALFTEANAKDPTDELRWLKEDVTAALAQFTNNAEHRSGIIETILTGFELVEAASHLNNRLITTLIDFKATTALAEIEAIDNEGLLDHSLHGDLEEIEIALSIRTERSSLIPSDEPMNPRHSLHLRKEQLGPIPDNASSAEIIDHYLTLYQSSDSIANHVELKGYFAATAIITPRLDLKRVSQIAWSGHGIGTRAIPWLSQEDQDDFFAHVEISYRSVFKAVNALDYAIPADLTSWCRGFLLGMKGVKTDHPVLKPLLSDLISAATLPSSKKLTTEEMDQAREGISDRLQGYTARHLEIKAEAHARLDNPQPTGPAKREAPKINRNEPCPCGSGKKFKKCCL